MAGLYARVANRGFPSSVAQGVTGAGALDSQGHPVDPSHGSLSAFAGRTRQTLPQFAPEGPPPPQEVLLEGTWGIPGDLQDFTDTTPGPEYWIMSDVNGNNAGGIGFRSHATPGFFPGWSGNYGPSDDLAQLHDNSVEIHSLKPEERRPEWHIARDAIDESQLRWETETHANDPGEAVGLVQLQGAARSIGRQGDAVQGYDLRNRYGFDAGHRDRIRPVAHVVNAYLDPGERPFIVPQAAGSFTPTDAVQGPEPWNSFRHSESVNYTPPTNYVAPVDSETTIPPGSQSAAPVAAGWW